MIRTPSVTDSTGGARSEKQASERGQMVKTADQMVQLAAENGLKVSPAVAASLLPTPVTTDHKQNDSPAAWNRNSPQMGTIVHSTDWGKFKPAIKRWETVIGRTAPAPTKPDGKDGAHRLSSAFTEWMMGLPDGWITNCGLTRNEELKACGNGVVPQQAELALRILLDGVSLERERERVVMLPTPTVSDTFTDALGSTQQKPGSMHSVTLPQAVRQIGETGK